MSRQDPARSSSFPTTGSQPLLAAIAAREGIDLRSRCSCSPIRTLHRGVIAAQQARRRRCGSCSTPRAAIGEDRERRTPQGAARRAASTSRDSNPAFDVSRTRSRWSSTTRSRFVKSLNWAPEEPQRDARLRGDHDAIPTKSPRSWSASRPTGSASAFVPPPKSHADLVQRGNGRERVRALHRPARRSTLLLQNERYQDAVIIERLVRAQRAASRCTSWRARRTR